MSGYANDTYRTVVIAEETTPGVAPAVRGQLLRRTSCNITLAGSKLTNDEFRGSNQTKDWYLGARQVTGTLTGQLSAGSFTMLFEAMLRKKFSPGILATVADAALGPSASGNTGTWLAEGTNFQGLGIREGDVFNFTNFAATNQNFVATYAGLNLLQFNAPYQAQFSNVSAGGVQVLGSKTLMPATGQVSLSFSIENQYNDIGQYDLFTGCYLSSMSVSAPASGGATFSADLVGFQVFSSSVPTYRIPIDVTESHFLNTNTGTIAIDGVQFAGITSFTLNLSAQALADARVGSDYPTAIYLGNMAISGTLTAMLVSGDSLAPGFLAETPFTVSLMMSDSQAGNAQFLSIFLTNVKLTDLNPQDSGNAILRSFSFIALENVMATDVDLSTITVQDSIGPSTAWLQPAALFSESGGVLYAEGATTSEPLEEE